MPTLEEIKKRKQYITYANQTEEKYGLPKNLLVGVMGAESNFNPNAVSHVGAKGLMQFMKATAQEYGINPLNPSESINAAGKYLQSSYKKFGNWEDALRSYNMGVGGLQKVKAGKKSLPKETKDYVGRVYKYAGIKYEDPSYVNTSPQDNNQVQETITPTLNYFNIPKEITTFASVPDSAEEKTTDKIDKDVEEVETKTKEYNFLEALQNLQQEDYSHLQPEQVAQQQIVPQVDFNQQYEQVSQFIDEPLVAQQGLTWQEKLANRPRKPTVAEIIAEGDARKVQQRVQTDNIPNTKRDLSLMLAEHNNIKKDEQELRTTGQIKNPNSIQYKRNVRTQPDIKQDNISAEQRNAPLNPLQRPLIYLANPEKVLGDLGVPNMETSELDRQAINENRFNPNQSGTDRFLNNAKIGLGYVPEAALNTALAAAFIPEGSGALGLVNETLNPLAGTGTVFKYTAKKIKNQASLVKDLLFDKNTTLRKNFIFDSKDKIYNQIEEGYKTLDNALGQKIKELNTEEGYKRLVNQEKEYLQDFYYDPKNVDLEKVAIKNADARIEELENIKAFGNKNKEFAYNVDKNKVDKVGIFKPHIETVQHRYDIPTNNAHYQYTDDITDNPSGSKMLPGQLTLGRGYENSVPTAFHEINHAIQRGRTLKIDNELKSIVPDYKKNLSFDDINAYTYFKSGSDGQESSSFLAELRSQMQKDGFIKNTYDEITPDLIEKAKDYYTKNKTKEVFVTNRGLQGLTNTRILDFSRATPENYKIISDAMNKLPAIAPIAGASYLATQGQEEPKKLQQGGEFSENELAFLSEIAIKDNNGYWNKNNEGKVIEIEGNQITMNGVDQDLIGIGIDKKGKKTEQKTMKAGKNYNFDKAIKVIEIPLFKK